MKTVLVTAPLSKIRNKQAGDWRITPEGFKVLAADLKDADMELCLLIHELIEARLCQKFGITDAVVTKFDKTFRGRGEPGDAAGCPYRRQHSAASAIEHHLAVVLGVDWDAYERAIDKLFK